jgi:catechol 2,3-dioxygenase-like lactoylglutathione lyase family enzyme
MFSHVTLGSNDIAASKAFYDAILGVLGAPQGRVDERGRLIYGHNGGRLVITRPVNGTAAESGNGHTLGLLCDSPATVDAWHSAGLAHGGSTTEDPPGVRNATEGRVLYLAYLRDPAGNKLCGFHKISG